MQCKQKDTLLLQNHFSNSFKNYRCTPKITQVILFSNLFYLSEAIVVNAWDKSSLDVFSLGGGRGGG